MAGTLTSALYLDEWWGWAVWSESSEITQNNEWTSCSPSSHAPKEGREMRGGREEEEGRVVTLDKFHFPVGKVMGDLTSGTALEGQRASGCKGVP